MIAKERMRFALAVYLLLALALAVTFYVASEFFGLKIYWSLLFISAISILTSLLVFFAPMRFVWPFIDSSKYDEERITFSLGAVLVFLSYPAALLSIETSFRIWVLVCLAVTLIALVAATFYFLCSDKFRVTA